MVAELRFEQAAAVKASGRRLGDYLNLGAGPTILTIRDTGTFSEGYNGAKFVTVATASGRRKVTVKDYVTATNSLRPDVAVAMAHEVRCKCAGLHAQRRGGCHANALRRPCCHPSTLPGRVI